MLAEKFTDYKDVPLLICHGDADNVIPFKRSRMTLQFLQSLDFDYLFFKKYRGLKHRIDKKVFIDFLIKLVFVALLIKKFSIGNGIYSHVYLKMFTAIVY